MIALALTLALTGAPCEEVFDRTEDCVSPRALPVDVVDPPSAPVSEGSDARVVGGRFFAASGVMLVLATSAASLAVWTGDHLNGLGQTGNLDGTTLTTLRDQQQAAVVTATVGFVSSFILVGTGLSLFVFDPEEGGVRPPFEIRE